MILFSQRHSPFARKAEVALLEVGLATVEICHLAPHLTADDDPAHEANPLNAAPLLILADGRGIFDSDEICFYIDEFSGGMLLPKGSMERQDVLTRQLLATKICELGADLHWEIAQNDVGVVVPGLRDDLIVQLSAAYEILEDAPDLEQTADVGTIALATALDWLAFLTLEIHMPAHPKLAHWLDTFRQRPSMTATEYEGAGAVVAAHAPVTLDASDEDALDFESLMLDLVALQTEELDPASQEPVELSPEDDKYPPGT